MAVFFELCHRLGTLEIVSRLVRCKAAKTAPLTKFIITLQLQENQSTPYVHMQLPETRHEGVRGFFALLNG